MSSKPFTAPHEGSTSACSRKPWSRGLLLVLASGLMASCITTDTHSIRSHDPQSIWVRPTPQFRRKLEEQASRVPYLQRTEDVLEVIRFFVQARESAYDLLLEMASSVEPKVAGTALAALGATRDERLAPFVRALEMQADGGRHLEYERARCLVKLGDWDDLSLLVSGLRDEGLMCRAQCFKALREATHLSHGFYPQGEEDEREAAVQAWEAWLADRASAGI